jgi:hypothetical protein
MLGRAMKRAVQFNATISIDSLDQSFRNLDYKARIVIRILLPTIIPLSGLVVLPFLSIKYWGSVALYSAGFAICMAAMTVNVLAFSLVSYLIAQMLYEDKLLLPPVVVLTILVVGICMFTPRVRSRKRLTL